MTMHLNSLFFAVSLFDLLCHSHGSGNPKTEALDSCSPLTTCRDKLRRNDEVSQSFSRVINILDACLPKGTLLKGKRFDSIHDLLSDF